jgi:hypothetical protein
MTTRGAPLKDADVIALRPFVTPGPAVRTATPGPRVHDAHAAGSSALIERPDVTTIQSEQRVDSKAGEGGDGQLACLTHDPISHIRNLLRVLEEGHSSSTGRGDAEKASEEDETESVILVRRGRCEQVVEAGLSGIREWASPSPPAMPTSGTLRRVHDQLQPCAYSEVVFSFYDRGEQDMGLKIVCDISR